MALVYKDGNTAHTVFMISVCSWRLWNTKERKNETEDMKRVVVQP